MLDGANTLRCVALNSEISDRHLSCFVLSSPADFGISTRKTGRQASVFQPTCTMARGLSVVYTPQVECRTNLEYLIPAPIPSISTLSFPAGFCFDLNSIIFVHGLGGGGENTWTEVGGGSDGKKCFWPKDLLPGIMPIDIHPRIMTFEYAASPFKAGRWSKEKEEEEEEDQVQLICHFAARLLECVVQKREGVVVSKEGLGKIDFDP